MLLSFCAELSLLCFPVLRSLVDTSMIPFGRAYLLIIVMSILIVGGESLFFLSSLSPELEK